MPLNTRLVALPILVHRTSQGFTLVEVAVLTGIVGLLLAIAVPNFLKHHQDARRQLCIHNLNQIDIAKMTWAMNTGMGPQEEPSRDDLAPLFADDRLPECPADGIYDIGPVNEPTLCSIVDFGHVSQAGSTLYEDAPPTGAPPPGKPVKPKPGGGH